MNKEEIKKIPRIVVYGSKGFEEIIPRFKTFTGKSFPVLFSGISVDCRELAADIIAAELELTIYRVNLSALKDKYVGETEKNLNRIFMEASSCNAVLFVDEADALFGRRSEMGTEGGRFLNEEIRYLHHKIEEYNGIVILATHHSQCIDEAFLRNMRFVVEFPEIDEGCRKKAVRKKSKRFYA